MNHWPAEAEAEEEGRRFFKDWAKLREGRSDPERLNDVWAMDFVHDQLYDGTKIRVLTIIDAFTRYVPAIDVRRSYTGADVVDTL